MHVNRRILTAQIGSMKTDQLKLSSLDRIPVHFQKRRRFWRSRHPQRSNGPLPCRGLWQTLSWAPLCISECFYQSRRRLVFEIPVDRSQKLLMPDGLSLIYHSPQQLLTKTIKIILNLIKFITIIYYLFKVDRMMIFIAGFLSERYI